MKQKNFVTRTLNYKCKAKTSKKVQFKLFKVYRKQLILPQIGTIYYILTYLTHIFRTKNILLVLLSKKGEKVELYMILAIKHVRNIQRVGLISYK